MSELLLSYPDHYFFICGSIREADYYKICLSLLQSKTLNSPSLLSRLGIIDYILYDDFLNVLKETNLILNTSFAEGMSGSIIEAQLLGVPVLVRNNEGNMVLVKDDVNGLVFGDMKEFCEKYKRIWEEKGLVERLRDKGLETVKEFDFNREKEEYIEMIRDVQRECYKEVEIGGEMYRLLARKEVHQIFNENTEIFNVFSSFFPFLLI